MPNSTKNKTFPNISEKTAICISSSNKFKSKIHIIEALTNKYSNDPVYSETYIKSKAKDKVIINQIISSLHSTDDNNHSFYDKYNFMVKKYYQLNIMISKHFPDGSCEIGHPCLIMVRDTKSRYILSYYIKLDKE